jgi:hypothetical protein
MVATSRRISEYSLTVQADPLEKISKIWSDPVFTQVIAAVVIFAGGAVLLFLRDQLFPGLTEERALFILCGLTALALAAVLLFAQAPRATLALVLDREFPHCPIVIVEIDNPNFRRLRIASVQFVTKGNWDIPDTRVLATAAPVIPFITRLKEYIKISPAMDSESSRAVDRTLPRRGYVAPEFRLTTDHSPFSGVGIFPFFLECYLVYGANRRRKLAEIVVSLHGQTVLSSTTFQTPFPFLVKSGDIKNNANQALSKISSGADCLPELRAALEKLAGTAA